MSDVSTFQDVYALIAELWCGPPADDAEKSELVGEAAQVMERLGRIDQDSATLLSRFLDANTIAEEDYVDLFELDPKCALYLGSHTYEEPKTCANAAVSDRNEYMIDLIGVYRHFGRVPNGKELPDFLPLIVDFLSLTVEARTDPVRVKFVEEYVLPYLPQFRSRLEGLDTPYTDLLDALKRVINVEQKAH